MVRRVNKVRTYLILTVPALTLTPSPPVAKVPVPLPQPAQNKMADCGLTSQYLVKLLQEINIRTLLVKIHHLYEPYDVILRNPYEGGAESRLSFLIVIEVRRTYMNAR